MSLERILTVTLLTLSTIGATAQDDDWAQFGRYAEANAAAQSGARAVFMGDSITDIWAQQDPDFFTLNDFVGRGISGQTTSQMLVRFRRDVIDLRPPADTYHPKIRWATSYRCASWRVPTA